MRCQAIRLCAASATAVGAAAANAAGGVGYSGRLESFCDAMKGRGARFDGVRVAASEQTARGLFAECVFRENTTVLSVPLDTMAVSAERLLASSDGLRALRPPSLDDVARLMTSRSIQDPVLYEQVHLALLLAAEHNRADSPFNGYLDILPHPAVDDAATIAQHKDVVDPLVLVEWDDYQREFLSVLRVLLRRWGDAAPPVEVAYWALRTVFARAHMLPSHGAAPEGLGSTLNYAALSTVDRAEGQVSWMRRLRSTIGAALGNPTAGVKYRLVPTLVPLLDMAGHVPSGNVAVEVRAAAEGDGSSVELRALRQIEKGEEIGLRFSTAQSPAFLLYRFGFIPQ